MSARGLAVVLTLALHLAITGVASAQTATTPAAMTTTSSSGSPDPTKNDPSISGWVATAAVGGAIGVLVIFVIAGRRSASPTTRPPRPR